MLKSLHNLGKILRELREKHGYTQMEVAKRLNVSALSIGRWGQNAKNPTTEHLIELSILYNMPINCLLGVPMEDVLVIESLSKEQQKLIQDIASQFYASGYKKTAQINNKQQQIVSSLLQQFSR